MKKLFGKKGFTLVEMLIVVVIIGILAAALIPKLTGAQARARDAARKANLNQATAAVATFFSDNGVFPGTGGSTKSLDQVKYALIPAYINSIPADPQSSKEVTITTVGVVTGGQYAYTPITRNSTKFAGMVLGANIESEGANANWVVLGTSATSGTNVPATVKTTITLSPSGLITSTSTAAGSTESIELEKTICNKVTIGSSGSMFDPNKCTALSNNQMVYLVIQ